MSQKHKTEVLVVGAGPVGMFTALLLARSGVATRIIDQESRTAGHSYACALHPRTLQLLCEAGIAGEAFQIGRRINSVGFYDGDSRQAELQLSHLPVRFPFLLVLQQSQLEDLLEAELRRANVKIEWNHRLDTVEEDEGAVAVVDRLEFGGSGYIVPEFQRSVHSTSQLETKFIIGADGNNSLVRRRLGIQCDRAGGSQSFAVFEADGTDDSGHEVKVILDDKTDNVMWPLTDSRRRWSFQLSPEELVDEFPPKDRERYVVEEAAGEDDRLHRLGRLLKQRAPQHQNSINSVTWTGYVQFEKRLARQFGRNSCWLAGDAAHQTGPIGMQSMNIGFCEAAELATAVKQILSNGGSQDLLQSYNRTRWIQWRRLLGITGEPQSTSAASEWVRRRASRILGCVPASGEELVLLLQSLGLTFK